MDRRALQDSFHSGRQALASSTTFKVTKPDGTVYEVTTQHKYSDRSSTRCADKQEELRMEELSVKEQHIKAWAARDTAAGAQQPAAERTEEQLAKAARRREKKAEKKAEVKQQLDKLRQIEEQQAAAGQAAAAEAEAAAAAAAAEEARLRGLLRQALLHITPRAAAEGRRKGVPTAAARAAFAPGEELYEVTVPNGAATAMQPVELMQAIRDGLGEALAGRLSEPHFERACKNFADNMVAQELARAGDDVAMQSG